MRPPGTVLFLLASITFVVESVPLSTLFRVAGLELPQLTAKGKSVKKLLIVSQGSGFCNTGRDDWRGDMPRYISAFLPQAQSLVVHGRQRISKSTRCRYCVPDSVRSGEDRTVRYDCCIHLPSM